jgi:hypothetical protein
MNARDMALVYVMIYVAFLVMTLAGLAVAGLGVS